MSGYIILNEDNSHYFFSRGDQDVSSLELEALIDQYAASQVRELVLNVNCMRTSYDSHVWDPIWQGYDPASGDNQSIFASMSDGERKWGKNYVQLAWRLHQAGIDPYQKWISRCRAVGISPWISLRMNDVHNVDHIDNYLHSTLWRERPDLHRVRYKFDRWTDRAFDYGQPEVRAQMLKLIGEVAERYDLDGLELDWMRFGFHFRPGYEDEGAAIVTEFTAEVRRLLDEQGARRGKRIALSARVPSRPEAARALGMDAAEWARLGLIDKLIVTPFWETIDTDIPLEIWQQLLRGTGVKLAAGLELLIRAYPESPLRQKNTLQTARGAAMSYLSRGADYVYLFNYMDSLAALDQISDYPQLLRELGSLETLRGKARRHVVTYADTWAPGQDRGTLLPLRCSAEHYASVRVHIGERPIGCNAVVALGFEQTEVAATEVLCEVWVNGERCENIGERELAAPGPDGPVHIYAIPAVALKDGNHVVDIKSDREATLIWAEIMISEG